MTTAVSAGTSTAAGMRALAQPHYRQHDELIGRSFVGPFDDLPADRIVALVTTAPTWPVERPARRRHGLMTVLDWLATQPGEGWQARWLNGRGDDGLHWVETFTCDDPRVLRSRRFEVTAGLRALMACRVVQPSYAFLSRHRNPALFTDVTTCRGADHFAQLPAIGARLGLNQDHLADARAVLTRMLLHTGKDFDQLTAEDLYEYRSTYWAEHSSGPTGLHTAWDVLREFGLLPADSTLRQQLRPGQKTTAQLVDRYTIACRPIRELLIRYLNERRLSIDYTTLRSLVSYLVKNFWFDIEQHHPGIDTLHLPTEVALAWKHRLATVTDSAGNRTARSSRFDIMAAVRGFYLDLQEWAVEDPAWVPFAVPSPVKRGDTDGLSKHKRKRSAAMHQRVRERLPLLADLIEAVERHHADCQQLLAIASATTIGQRFRHRDSDYQRVQSHRSVRSGPDGVVAIHLATGAALDLVHREDDAFWGWAIIETLRHSGVRIEELVELTHLALVSYTLPKTGELIPLLQIVPSKTNEERLLLVSPELASVLATIITRLRHRNGGTIALVARYDDYEATTGPALPHLFQRRHGPQPRVMSTSAIRGLLNATLARTDLRDAAGRPLRFTPHDFRRIFTTEAVAHGLPVHIAARLLGHRNINTIQAYLAIFQDDLVQTYRSFLDKRRALRPTAEYRDPTDDEWREFQQHFEQRKVSLGTCGRPYGTPCRHEHACIRCPVLRVDPKQRHRLIDIANNLTDRIDEARRNGWLGEVQGLEISLAAARNKITALDKSLTTTPQTGLTNLGLPVIRQP